jgi:hypothetical protein
MAGVNTKNPNLPRARPSHHWGKVVKPPAINKPVFGAAPPGSTYGPAQPAAAPGSLQDILNQLQSMLESTPLTSIFLYLPDFYPIPTATEFQVGGQVTTSGAGTITQIPGSVLQLPPGYIGLVHTFNISVLTTMTTATNQTWTIRVNQAPAYTRFLAGRAAQNLERSFDTALRIPKGAQIDIVNTNIDGATYTVGADVTGWYMSVADVTRWIQGQGQLTSST